MLVVIFSKQRFIQSKNQTICWILYNRLVALKMTPTDVTLETFFIDRMAFIFKHVLALLIDETYDYPKKYISELDYFGIEYDKSKYEKTYLNLQKEKDEHLVYLIKIE